MSTRADRPITENSRALSPCFFADSLKTRIGTLLAYASSMTRQQYTSYSARSKFSFLNVVLAAAVVQFLWMARSGHLVLNSSTSMPRGIYRTVNKRLARGVIVGACIDGPYAKLAQERGYLNHGRCRSGIRPVMKFIAAVPGDSVEIRLSGVSINGESIPNTPVLKADPFGRYLPNALGRYTVQPGEYWIIANHDQGSFDSRYFGPVKEILGVVEPLLTESDLCTFSVFHKFIRC